MDLNKPLNYLADIGILIPVEGGYIAYDMAEEDLTEYMSFLDQVEAKP